MAKEVDAAHHEFAITKDSAQNVPTGTVKLVEDGEIVLIPTPSPDPRGRTHTQLQSPTLSSTIVADNNEILSTYPNGRNG